MTEQKKRTLGSAIFADIESNEYLNKLYGDILFNYGLKKMNIQNAESKYRQIDLLSALRFADLLSKSTHPENATAHKMWAQEIIILLSEVAEESELVKLYAGSVFANTGNHQGMQIIKSDYKGHSTLEKIFSEFQNDYLTIPAAPELRFFKDQKEAYDHLNDPYFSYSGPTSMGKSFIMRMFIKEQVENNAKLNFALLVPTKALINEVKGKIIDDLKDNLRLKNYRVVTAAGELALEEKHNFILVLTPERMLYLLIKRKDLSIDYLFVDEAHKLSGKNSRGPFYYKVVDMLLNREDKPHFIFAAPNIPNPQVYLRLLTDIIEGDQPENKLRSIYSPVSQVKFLVDMQQQTIQIYNDKNDSGMLVAVFKNKLDLAHLLYRFERTNQTLTEDKKQQTIVYCNGRNKAIDEANQFADLVKLEKNDKDLNELSDDIKKEVHGDYYLARLIRMGIAYHIGYLPSSIRRRIEELFERRKITTLFCTSTLLEGVNLPADNLFITDTKIFRSKMSSVDFRNLIGRVGRIRFNLHGNVFFVASGEKDETVQDFKEMLQEEIPEQSLSITTNPKVLKRIEKKYIADTLKNGTTDMPKRTDSQSEESYEMMRKFELVLLRDIMQNRDSLVRREFREFITPEEENEIRRQFDDPFILPDDDINTSVDQTKNVVKAIMQENLEYPNVIDGKFDYEEIVTFLRKLADIYDWRTYEYSGLGKHDKDGNLQLIRWYAVILRQWMEGKGLNWIMKSAVQYREEHPDDFWISKYQKTRYNYGLNHKNIVLSQTLEVIDNIILFSISNYFLKFSNEYMRIHNITEWNNNWYEFVEYGTTNPVTIQLQRHGFSREAATDIKEKHSECIVYQADGSIKLKHSLFDCRNENTITEARQVIYNSPELFLDEAQ